jgi:hypothetical protein
MPTVMTINGMRVVIYPNDHRPPHVHVIAAEGSAVINLNCPNGCPSLRENHGLSRAQLRQILEEIDGNLTNLCNAWQRIHGYV